MTLLARPRPLARRLTLVELMVAVALGMILVGVITFVWMQSNRIFTTTIHRLETYQRLRTVLDGMERDLANTSRTVNMEFFVDTPLEGRESGNGYYDPADAPLSVEGVHYRVPRDPEDPVVRDADGEPPREFGIADFSTDEVPYLFAPTIVSPTPYMIGAGYTDERAYWRDEIMVRSFVAVDGRNRPAMVHYRLVQQADGRSVLRRRIWYLNESNAIEPANRDSFPATQGTDRVALLAHGVADLKIGFFFKETPSQGTGKWYHVGDPSGRFKEAADDGRADELRKDDEEAGFRPARSPTVGLSTQHVDQFEKDQNAISFFYRGNARVELGERGAPVLRTLKRDEDDLTRLPLEDLPGDLAHYEVFSFPGVRTGDSILLFEATDDDSVQATEDTPRTAGDVFPDRVFTIDTLYADRSERFVAVKLREPIDFFRLRQDWLGEEPLVHVLPSHVGSVDAPGQYSDAGPADDITPFGDDGPDDGRKIVSSFNVKYRIGFLPAALLVRLSSDDRYNRKILPMERVIRLIQQ